MKELQIWKMKLILMKNDQKYFSKLLRWLSYRMLKLTEFLFKRSVEVQHKKKKAYSVIYYMSIVPQFPQGKQ